MPLGRRAAFLAVPVLVYLAGCTSSRSLAEPVVEFTKLPPFAAGSSEKLQPIEGRVTGALPGQKIILYARSGAWWIQPLAAEPFTQIEGGATWKNRTHPGSAYAALLVAAGYQPSLKIDKLPERSEQVLAVQVVQNRGELRPPGKLLLFGGYEWLVRDSPSNPGGTRNIYDISNAWTDDGGSLHLRIEGDAQKWSSAEVSLLRSLGYGSYRYVVRDVSQLEPSMVFSMLTWDNDGPSREMDIEVSKWGDAEATRNAQFVIQPYHVPANTVQFPLSGRTVTFMLRWAPGKASFKAFRGAVQRWDAPAVSEHSFTSGVPAPGSETVHFNLYVFGSTSSPLKRGTEVVVEQFEYLP